MNPTITSLTDSELVRHALNNGDALSQLMAERLEALLPLQQCADVLETNSLDPSDPKALDRELESLYDDRNSLEERTAELEATQEELRQAEAEILELREELRELERQAG